MLPKLQLNVWVLNVRVPDVPVLIVWVLNVPEPNYCSYCCYWDT